MNDRMPVCESGNRRAKQKSGKYSIQQSRYTATCARPSKQEKKEINIKNEQKTIEN